VARAACRSADVVFALTPAEAASMTSAGAAPDRIRFIPQACELTGTPDPAGFRRASGLTGQIVLFAGRRTAFKGYLELLSSMPLVWDRLPEVTFVFIGPNSDASAAEEFRAHADRRLVDLGVVDDQTKHDALAACDVLCLPTSYDVFPLVFAEAWTLGKPVISGDFPGSEVVVRDGVDGLIVKPRPAELADALVRLLSDHGFRQSLGRAGLRRAESEFGWDKMADAFQDGYGWALDQKAGPRA
jgi:glycosyltransferase involved in cell wall biosynthesis